MVSISLPKPPRVRLRTPAWPPAATAVIAAATASGARAAAGVRRMLTPVTPLGRTVAVIGLTCWVAGWQLARGLLTADDTSPVRLVVMMLTTPAGAPARMSTSPIHSAVRGVSLAGLRMAVQPAARAGASFRVAMAAGKFHGVIM